ncbi:MAG: class I SAM-dependent methyltransferase [Candidatus Omnitrophica bacterium]|jgi:ubiquinone/menaquinone biosynthesis C-methylase UbiE|nr:class I SAM-dependent methyltransferase [Candidatus Omnitrophota bacterium]
MKLEVFKNNIEQFYDEKYRGSYMQKHQGLAVLRIKEVLENIPIKADGILDYGCGQGGWIKELKNKFPNSNIYGIDISRVAIQRAKEKFPKCNFCYFDGDSLPFSGEYFDLIFSYHVFEHVSNISKTISNISYLLKKNGYLCVAFPCANRNSFEERITSLTKNGKEEMLEGEERFFYEGIEHIRRMKSQDLIDLCAKNNLCVYKEFYAHQFWGAIDWISKSQTSFIREIFNYKKGISLKAAVKLFFLRMIFLMLRLPIKLYTADIIKHIKLTKSYLKKAILISLFPLKVLAGVLGKTIEAMAILEWKFSKTKRNGSEQFFIFKKIQ